MYSFMELTLIIRRFIVLKNQKRVQLAIALLIGMFILGGTLLNIAIGQDDPNFDRTIYFDEFGNEVEEEDAVVTLNLVADAFGGTTDSGHSIDIAGESASVSISGERIVDGVTIGSISISGGVYAYTDDTFCYYGSAYSIINGDNTGKANAWVRINGEQLDHSRGRGDVDVGGYYPSHVSAWHLIEQDNLGGNNVSAGAALGFQGVRVNVRFDVSGV